MRITAKIGVPMTLWVKSRPHAILKRCPLCPRKRTIIDTTGMSALCRYCCKSPKLPGDNFSAVRRFDRRPPIYVVSITLPRSPVSLSSGDEVPHIFTRKSRLQPGEFLITSAKRLLQQYLPKGDIRIAANSPLLDHLVRQGEHGRRMRGVVLPHHPR